MEEALIYGKDVPVSVHSLLAHARALACVRACVPEEKKNREKQFLAELRACALAHVSVCALFTILCCRSYPVRVFAAVEAEAASTLANSAHRNTWGTGRGGAGVGGFPRGGWVPPPLLTTSDCLSAP